MFCALHWPKTLKLCYFWCFCHRIWNRRYSPRFWQDLVHVVVFAFSSHHVQKQGVLLQWFCRAKKAEKRCQETSKIIFSMTVALSLVLDPPFWALHPGTLLVERPSMNPILAGAILFCTEYERSIFEMSKPSANLLLWFSKLFLLPFQPVLWALFPLATACRSRV